MTDTKTPSLSLNDGTTIPQLGFGVWQVPDDQAQVATEEALRVGYRLIDTAAIYGNEAGVGRAIAASDVNRDEMYITTKLWNGEQGYDSTLRAFDVSMDKLGLDVLDLYLIHWPCPKADKFTDTWKAFVELKKSGRVRSIGVSNFHAPHLDKIIDATGEVPVLNQVELHPYFQQGALREVNASHQIATEAWSPLGSGHGLLEDATLTAIAATHGVTPAQVVLAWHLQVGNVVIPKSVTPSRIAENFAATSVTLSEDEMTKIAGLDAGTRYGGDPDVANYGLD
ncbi:aldo/keto reductase [Ruania alba]|uniref:2,5-diketo-D-gluconate reductase A n=1 Tax=Ruania alba TaxID=648782 RepID=A0A1H5MZY7_9MICO|nr:aldo/keto reductase [Ruania alba]SEE94884.1 2,5-diketo-D-gluconate reductase A [Ruania alba]